MRINNLILDAMNNVFDYGAPTNWDFLTRKWDAAEEWRGASVYNFSALENFVVKKEKQC